MYPTQLHSYLLWRSSVPPAPQSLAQRRFTAIVSLIPVIMVGIFVFGWWAATVMLTSVLVCGITDWVTHNYIYKDSPGTREGTWLLTGLLIALMMPPNVPIWLPIVGGIVAIFFGKYYFSVDGMPLLQPAALGLLALHLVGLIVMIFATANPMNPVGRWPMLTRGIETMAESARDGRYITEFFGGDVRDSISREKLNREATKSNATPKAAVHGPRPIDLVRSEPTRPLSAPPKEGSGDVRRYKWLDLLLGYVPGCIASSAMALGFGILLLIFARAHSWVLPFFAILTMTGAMYLLSLIYGASVSAPFIADNIPVHMLAGSTLIGIFYFAADPTLSPRSFMGKMYAGITFGLVEVFFRFIGMTEGIFLSIIIVQCLSFVFDQYLAPPKEESVAPQTSLTPSSLGRL